jgi:hypothetical protein
MTKNIKKDPENYKQMAVPYENQDEANKAMSSFYDELSELRKKHKVRDLVVIVYGSVISDGEEGEFMNSMAFGNSINHLAMAAFAYGKEKQSHNEMIQKLLAGKTS